MSEWPVMCGRKDDQVHFFVLRDGRSAISRSERVCGLKSEWPVMCRREDGAHNAKKIGPFAGTVF